MKWISAAAGDGPFLTEIASPGDCFSIWVMTQGLRRRSRRGKRLKGKAEIRRGLKGNNSHCYAMYKIENHRLQFLTQIIRLVTTMAPQQRTSHGIRENSQFSKTRDTFILSLMATRALTNNRSFPILSFIRRTSCQ
jgi:hypothetical protein